MKDSTLQTLITARALLEEAERHCTQGDRYLATAGLIVLQDAVELVFLAVLIEKDVDEERNVEKMTFDEMIAAIGQLGVKVPKTGTLKAMNKLRVTAKHYRQVMEPLTVRGHLNAAKIVIDVVLRAIVGKPLREIFLTELVGPIFSKTFLDESVSALNEGDYLRSLTATRKAFFLEFESDYCIYQYRDADPSQPNWLRFGWGSGRKADSWKRTAKWIESNVETPYDYVQLNFETWRVDAIEWGINTQMLNNIRRLTPDAVQLERSGEWFVRKPAGYAANSANHENAAHCLDLTIEAIRRKYEHVRAARTVGKDKPFETPSAYVGQPLFEKPAKSSKEMRTLLAGDSYVVEEILNGFDAQETYYRITVTPSGGSPLFENISGYVERLEAQPLHEAVNEIASAADSSDAVVDHVSSSDVGSQSH